MNSVHIFPTSFPKTRSNIISHLRLDLASSLFPSGTSTKIFMHFTSLPFILHAVQSHVPWFDYPNNKWWSVKAMKLLIMQSSPASHHFLPRRSKYSPQHPALRHPQSLFFHYRVTKFLRIYHLFILSLSRGLTRTILTNNKRRDFNHLAFTTSTGFCQSPKMTFVSGLRSNVLRIW